MFLSKSGKTIWSYNVPWQMQKLNIKIFTLRPAVAIVCGGVTIVVPASTHRCRRWRQEEPALYVQSVPPAAALKPATVLVLHAMFHYLSAGLLLSPMRGVSSLDLEKLQLQGGTLTLYLFVGTAFEADRAAFVQQHYAVCKQQHSA